MEKGEETGGDSPLLGVRVSDTIAKRCTQRVFTAEYGRQCSRKAVLGGDLCAIHTPEGVAARKAKLHAKWDARQKAYEERAAARRAQEERQARALIVAEEVVPELVAACIAALARITEIPYDPTDRKTLRVQDQLVDVIAKAEGRTS